MLSVSAKRVLKSWLKILRRVHIQTHTTLPMTYAPALTSPKAPHANCAACPLVAEPYVPTVGPTHANIALVGEAPGQTEVRRCAPFVGQSGKLLRAVVEKAGGDVAKCMVTNTVLCRCVDATGTNRQPTNDEINCCRPRLLYELEQRSAKRVITLGAVPLKALAPDKKGVLARRGRLQQSPHTNLPILPTLHPAFILRAPQMLKEFVRDIRWAFSADALEAHKAPELKVITPYGSEALAIMKRFMFSQALVIDTESAALDWRIEPMLEVALAHADKPNKVVVLSAELLRHTAIKRMFMNVVRSAERVVGHNLKYDLKVLQREFDLISASPDKTFDTLLAHYIVDERTGGHGLKHIATNEYGAEDYEAELLKHMPKGKKRFDKLPADKRRAYLALDVHYTARIYNDYAPRIDGDMRLKWLYENIIMPSSDLFQACEYDGIRIDRAHLQDVQIDWTQLLNTTVARLRERMRSNTFNPGSPKQVLLALHVLGYPTIYNELGKPTTGKAALAALAKQHPSDFLTDLFTFRRLSKLLGTYLKPMLALSALDGRLHAHFMVHGTLTGRPSSGKDSDAEIVGQKASGDNFNLLNIPRRYTPEGKAIRDGFIASEGMTLVEADGKQMEVRVLAYYSKDETLTKLLRDGVDVHGELARRVYGEAFTPEQRVRAKNGLFGQIYGQGVEGFAALYDISIAEAQRLIGVLMDMYPRVREWQRETEAIAFGAGITTTFGRRLRYPMLSREARGEVRRQALNFPIQSTAWDLTVLSALAARSAIEACGGRILNVVYDSILCEVPNAHAKRIATLLTHTLRDVPAQMLGERVPFDAEITTGQRWGSLA